MDRRIFFEKYPPQDGWIYQTGFNGDTQDESFARLKEFLKNGGLGDIPLPENARRLWWDYIRPDEDGNFGSFIWHPIRITQDTYQVNGLVLSVYDESYEDHERLWENSVRE